MARKERRKFKRPLGERRYRHMFVVATEGTKTEPIYFLMFNDTNTVVHVKHLRGNKKTSPKNVLLRMQKYLEDNSLRKGDEAWLVIDRDQWLEDHLVKLHEWSQTDDSYGLAVSNPNFEYWLLLHFEDGLGVINSDQCTDRLKHHLPNFEKGHIEVRKLQPGIKDAIQRAIGKDNPPCKDWPRTAGSTVYRLVKKLIREES